MWLYRRIMRVSLLDRITIDDILHTMEEDKEVLTAIKGSEFECLGSVRRYLECFSVSSTEVFTAAVTKFMITLMVTNIRNGEDS